MFSFDFRYFAYGDVRSVCLPVCRSFCPPINNYTVYDVLNKFLEIRPFFGYSCFFTRPQVRSVFFLYHVSSVHHDLTCTLGFLVYPIHQTSITHEASMAHFQYRTHLSRNETLYENEPHAVWKDLSCVNNFMSSVTRRRVLYGTLDITLDTSILIESTWCLLMVWGSFSHNDVIKWRHFPRYWPFVRGIHRWIPHTKASGAELWCFIWSAPEQTVE